MFRKLHRLLLPALLVAPAFAKTDLSGCTTTDISSPAGASVAWYVPGTGEICALLDCGGGRAPARTDVPGCPLYSGTATYSPSYLLGFGSTTAAAASSSSWSSETLDTESSSWDLYTTPATAPIGVLPSAYPTDSLSAMTTGTWSNQTTASATLNYTLTSPTPSPTSYSSMSSTASAAGAMETARFWLGSAGLVGLGALVAIF